MSELVIYFFLLVALISYFSSRIINLFTSNNINAFNYQVKPSGSKDFAILVNIDDYDYNEFTISLVDEWVLGHSFYAFGDADFSLNSIEQKKIKRCSFRFTSSKTALSSTNVIGNGKLFENSVELNICLTPELSKSLLDELRHHKNYDMLAHGFLDENDRLLVTFFEMNPSLD